MTRLAATPTDARLATTLAHGLDLLEAFSQGPAWLANKSLAQRTGLSKATISRLTTTLATRGLVDNDLAQGGHRLGSTALTLGYPLLSQLGLRRVARLPMKQLADELRATVSLGMRERSRMVYVETLRSNDPATFQPDPGAVLPMLQTAMGRAWLSAADAAQRRETLALLRDADPRHYRQWSASLPDAQAHLATHGFCLSAGDWLPDVHAVAVPLRLRFHGEQLVLNCGMPARRLRPAQLRSEIGPRLMQLAERIESDWSRELPPGQPSSAPPAWSRRARELREADPQDRSFARTLARGMDLLLCFEPTDESLGNREIARRLGLSPTTVVRLTHTLCGRGYLRQDPDTARYRLGAATLSLGYPILSGLRIRRIARPAMLALAERMKGAVSLGLRHQTGMTYVETAWRTDERLLPPDTGAPMPMLMTAMGRAWLGRAEANERDQLLNRIRVQDPEGYQRFHRAALDAASQCRRQGWCSSADFRAEIVAVAAPFERPVDGVRYVMNCGVLARGGTVGERRLGEIGAALRDTVRAIEAAASQD